MTSDAPIRSSPVPMGRQLARILRERIDAGAYHSDERLPDEESLARQFGVSRGTLRKAMADLEREGLITRKRGKGTFVTPAKHNADGRLPTIGLLVWDESYFFPDVVRGVSEEAHAHGYAVTIACSNPRRVTWNQEREDAALHRLLSAGVAGLLVVPNPFSKSDYGTHSKADVPVVLAVELCHLDEDNVIADSYTGARHAVEHLYGLGHRAIAHITHQDVRDVPARSERLRGFRETCARLGLAEQACPVIEVEHYHARTMGEALRDIARSNTPTTAFFCYNDVIARRLSEEIRMAGKAIPEDVSVMGFDDSDVARTCEVPLTSISQEAVHIGAIAARLVIEKIEKHDVGRKRTVLVAPRLVVRESTGPPSDADRRRVETDMDTEDNTPGITERRMRMNARQTGA